MKELMTAQEVCKLCRLEVKHPGRVLQHYRDKGMLNATKIGREFRYRAEDVKKFIDKCAGK